MRRWGSAPKFDFQPKPHWEVGEKAGILDLEAAARITGARFAVYKGWGARLERALANFFLDVHTREHGYTEILPPFLVNTASLMGAGQLPKFAADLFKLEDTDFWLTPTSEVELHNLYRDATLTEEQLPIPRDGVDGVFPFGSGRGGKRHARDSAPAPVSESGAVQVHASRRRATRSTKLWCAMRKRFCRNWDCTTARCCCAPATWDLRRRKRTTWKCGCRRATSFARFRRVRIAKRSRRGARGYDLSRRAEAKSEFVHTLNGSGLAVGRTWIAMVENYQQADGSIVIPEVLAAIHGD